MNGCTLLPSLQEIFKQALVRQARKICSDTQNINCFPQINITEFQNADSVSSSSLFLPLSIKPAAAESASHTVSTQSDQLPVTCISFTLFWTVYCVHVHECVFSMCVLCVHCVYVYMQASVCMCLFTYTSQWHVPTQNHVLCCYNY